MILDELIGKFDDMAVNSGMLASFDLFELAQRFFNQDDVKELVLDLNRDRLYYKNTDNMGVPMPLYAPKTAGHKKRVGLPYIRYTYYEIGRTHKSLELGVMDEFAMVVVGKDAPEYSAFLDARAWGITDEDYDNGVRDKLLVFVQEELKNYLLNG